MSFFCLPSLWAAEWSVEPGLDFLSTYNDNVWVSSNANWIFDMRLEPKLMLVRESESSLVSLNTTLSKKKYLSDDEETRTLFSADFNAAKELEHNILLLNVAFLESSTMNSETTGIRRELVEAIKTERKLTPTWRKSWTENFSTDLTFYYTNVSFEQTVQQWFDYQNLLSSISGLYQFNENLQWRIVGGASRYKTIDIDYVVDSLFWQTGLNYEWYDNHQLSFLLGGRRVDSVITRFRPDGGKQIIEEYSSQFTLDTNYILTLEKGRFDVNTSQELAPTSQGGMQFVNRIKFRGKRYFTSSWSMELNLIGEIRNNVGSNAATYVRDQDSIISQLRSEWRIDEYWKTALSYRWLTRLYDNQTEWINSHRVVFSTSYTWEKTVISH